MSLPWSSYLQLCGAVVVGAGLAYWSGDSNLLHMLAAGVVVAVLHYIDKGAIANIAGGK